MKKRRLTKADRKFYKKHHQSKDLMCAINGCNGIAGESQNYCLKHRRELRIAPDELFQLKYVYFVMAVGTDRIKIGTASDVENRISNMQVGIPNDLLLLVSVPGDRVLEKVLHKLLDKYRVRGEWFEMSDEVLDVIEAALENGRKGINLWIEKKKDELTTPTK